MMQCTFNFIHNLVKNLRMCKPHQLYVIIPKNWYFEKSLPYGLPLQGLGLLWDLCLSTCHWSDFCSLKRKDKVVTFYLSHIHIESVSVCVCWSPLSLGVEKHGALCDIDKRLVQICSSFWFLQLRKIPRWVTDVIFQDESTTREKKCYTQTVDIYFSIIFLGKLF